MADLELDGPNSAISVDTLKPKTGTTLTLGESGDTITLGSGATQSGFGPSGAVSWDTTEKTSDFNAVSGIGYFVDTTSASITATLPSSPSAGDIVAFKDYAATFGTNSLTIDRNGENIQGNASDSQIGTNRASVVLVYVDATKGWLYTSESNVSDLEAATFIQATGGTITTSGDYKIHTFTSSGTFTVSSLGNPIGGPNNVDYMVVAAGGGGGATSGYSGGGAGAGGFRESVPSPADWTASPLANPGNALPVSVQGYPITVGAGGSAGAPPLNNGTNGASSVFSTITSAGGGGGGGTNGPLSGGGFPGGSGGGGGYHPSTTPGGTGNTPSVSPPQGSNGGAGGPRGGTDDRSAGGGGATQTGTPHSSTPTAGPGGDGATTSFSGSPTAYAGGGGGGGRDAAGGTGGTGGGGSANPGSPGLQNGTVNTGGGAAGASPGTAAGTGGSGIVIIRYKFQ